MVTLRERIRNKLRYEASKLRSGKSGPDRPTPEESAYPDSPKDGREVSKLREQLARARRDLTVRDRELSEAKKKLDEAGSEAQAESGPRGAALLAAQSKLPEPFFILGPPKSGTSWLQATLNSHPEIFCSGEGKFFGRDFRTENPYGQWGAEVSAALSGLGYEHADRPSLYGALADSQDLKRWFNSNGRWTKNEETENHVRALVRLSADYVFSRGREESGKEIVGDKSPSHIQYIEEIAEFYPRAKVIHIIRDGRDQAVSSIFHWWRQAQDLGGFFPISAENAARRDAYYEDRSAFGPNARSLFDEATLRALAAFWRDSVGAARENGPRIFGERYFEVRYEDLQQSPERLFAAMIEFLGGGSDETLIREIVQKNSFETKAKRSVGTEDPKSFLRSGKSGDWKSHFTERDRRVYREEAGELLAKLGYENDEGGSPDAGLQKP